MPLSSTSPDALADRYVHQLSHVASVAELIEIRRRNSANTPHDRCASFDFRNGDALMASAFKALSGRAPDPSDAADQALIIAAWTIVRTQLLVERRPQQP